MTFDRKCAHAPCHERTDEEHPCCPFCTGVVTTIAVVGFMQAGPERRCVHCDVLLPPLEPLIESSQCPACGRIWLPSMGASETFPGSACDLQQCTLAFGDRG